MKHVLQPKDCVMFLPLKKQFWDTKSALIIYQEMTHRMVCIKGGHMLCLLKLPWEAAFFREEVVVV